MRIFVLRNANYAKENFAACEQMRFAVNDQNILTFAWNKLVFWTFKRDYAAVSSWNMHHHKQIFAIKIKLMFTTFHFSQNFRNIQNNFVQGGFQTGRQTRSNLTPMQSPPPVVQPPIRVRTIQPAKTYKIFDTKNIIDFLYFPILTDEEEVERFVLSFWIITIIA